MSQIKIVIVTPKQPIVDYISDYNDWRRTSWGRSYNLPKFVISKDSFNIVNKVINKDDLLINTSKSYKYAPKPKTVIEDKLKKPNLDNLKKYSFIVGTKFDREYFSRIYPDITRTTKHKLADIVIYDDNSLKNLLYSQTRYSFAKSNNNIMYLSNFTFQTYQSLMSYKDKESRNFCEGFLDIYPYSHCSGNFGASILRRIDKKDLLGKMIHIDDLLNKKTISGEISTLSNDEARNLLSQIKSSEGAAKTALETCIQYSNKYYLTKLLLFYTAHCIWSKIPVSNKLDYFKKHFSPMFISKWRRKEYDIFDHISNICQSAEKQIKANMETSVFKDLIQSDSFTKCFTDVKFKINIQIELPFSEIVDGTDEDVEIGDFIL